MENEKNCADTDKSENSKPESEDCEIFITRDDFNFPQQRGSTNRNLTFPNRLDNRNFPTLELNNKVWERHLLDTQHAAAQHSAAQHAVNGYGTMSNNNMRLPINTMPADQQFANHFNQGEFCQPPTDQSYIMGLALSGNYELQQAVLDYSRTYMQKAPLPYSESLNHNWEDPSPNFNGHQMLFVESNMQQGVAFTYNGFNIESFGVSNSHYQTNINAAAHCPTYNERDPHVEASGYENYNNLYQNHLNFPPNHHWNHPGYYQYSLHHNSTVWQNYPQNIQQPQETFIPTHGHLIPPPENMNSLSGNFFPTPENVIIPIENSIQPQASSNCDEEMCAHISSRTDEGHIIPIENSIQPQASSNCDEEMCAHISSRTDEGHIIPIENSIQPQASSNCDEAIFSPDEGTRQQEENIVFDLSGRLTPNIHEETAYRKQCFIERRNHQKLLMHKKRARLLQQDEQRPCFNDLNKVYYENPSDPHELIKSMTSPEKNSGAVVDQSATDGTNPNDSCEVFSSNSNTESSEAGEIRRSLLPEIPLSHEKMDNHSVHEQNQQNNSNCSAKNNTMETETMETNTSQSDGVETLPLWESGRNSSGEDSVFYANEESHGNTSSPQGRIINNSGETSASCVNPAFDSRSCSYIPAINDFSGLNVFAEFEKETRQALATRESVPSGSARVLGQQTDELGLTSENDEELYMDATISTTSPDETSHF